jgi:hypothetical protein
MVSLPIFYRNCFVYNLFIGTARLCCYSIEDLYFSPFCLDAIESNPGPTLEQEGVLTNEQLEEGLIPTTYSDRKRKKEKPADLLSRKIVCNCTSQPFLSLLT